MFPHALDKHSYPTKGFLERSKINLECYGDGRLINHGSIKLKLQCYLDKSFQDHYFYVVETKTPKEIIVGHPVSVRLGLICVLWKNVSKSISAIECKANTSSSNSFQDHQLNIDRKPQQRKQRSKSEPFEDHSSDSFIGMAQNAQSKTHFKTPHKSTGKSLLSRPSAKYGKNEPNVAPFKTIGSQSEKMAGSFKTMEDGSQKVTSFKTLTNRVKNLNPRYMVPANEGESSNFRSSDSKDGTTSQRSALKWSTTKRIKIQPHLCGAWIYIHQQYQGSSSIVPKQLWLGEMVHQEIITKQTEPIPWVSSLTYPKKENGKLKICLNPKDLNKAIIFENHKAPTLEEIAHVLTGATTFFKVDGNKAFFGMHLTQEASLLMTFNTDLAGTDFFVYDMDSKWAQISFRWEWMSLKPSSQEYWPYMRMCSPIGRMTKTMMPTS